MRFGIVENSVEDRERLTSFLKAFCQKEGIEYQLTCFSSLSDDLADLDIVFVDVQLDGQNSIEQLYKVPLVGPRLVLVSNYKKYLLDGYKVRADLFFLKPLHQVEFTLEMKRLIDEMQIEKAGFVDERIREGVILFKEILFVEARLRKTVITFVNQKEQVVSIPLREWEEILDKTMFCRIYKSILVNLMYVTSYHKMDVLLANSIQLPISRHYFKAFERQYLNSLSKWGRRYD